MGTLVIFCPFPRCSVFFQPMSSACCPVICPYYSTFVQYCPCIFLSFLALFRIFCVLSSIYFYFVKARNIPKLSFWPPVALTSPGHKHDRLQIMLFQIIIMLKLSTLVIFCPFPRSSVLFQPMSSALLSIYMSIIFHICPILSMIAHVFF